MPLQVLDRVYFYNTPSRWALALSVLLGAFLFLALTRRLLVHRLAIVAQRTRTTADDALVELVRRTRPYFMATVALVLATRFLALPLRADAVLRIVFIVALLLQCGAWGMAAVTYLVNREIDRRTAQSDLASAATMRALGVAAKIVLWAILGITALHVFGVDVTALVTGLGIGGIALALAVQNVLADLLAALSIVLDKPFEVGHTINLDGLVGTVENIGLKTTRLRALSGEQVIVSNNDMLKSRIRNYRRMYERRIVFSVDVTYDTPPDLVAAIPAMIREAITAQEPVRFDRSHFVAYTDSTLRVESVYYVLDPDYTKYLNVHHAVNLAILRRFAAEGIQFAYPTRTLQLDARVRDELTAAAAPPDAPRRMIGPAGTGETADGTSSAASPA